ncbi:hypothetical protein MSPP1_004088 [Malassezia sp. CBS 17886]|nr:hypothetical protein MSPP1_004088 [Malassezia sp. CBS 17886]
MSAGAAQKDALPALFERTPVAAAKRQGPPRFVRTAACLIIGDEVLNGKTLDTNSNRMAALCFEYGIELRRVEVIPDDEPTIVEAAQRLSRAFDWVVTSGGIGPTPDDITYAALARAFGGEPLEHHAETVRRMDEGVRRRYGGGHVDEDVMRARRRMALFPRSAEVFFPTAEYWVPVVRVNGNVCILPGVPRIFDALLHAMIPYLELDPAQPRPIRCLIHTPLPESALSPLLERLTAEGKRDGIRVGSYPKWDAGVHVSLIGSDSGVVDRYAAIVLAETSGERL